MENIHGRFWLTWNPAGQNPQIRHSIPAYAIEEAKRLAGQTGKDVYVLEAIAVARQTRPPVECIALLPPITPPPREEVPA